MLSALDGGHPDRADAVRIDGVACSWERLRDAAEAVAAGLRGAPAIAVVARPELSTVVTIVAGLLAGVPVVPVPPDAGPVEAGHILADSGAVLLFDGPAPPAELRPGRVSTSDAAMVLYTSGTTGPPKGVQVSREAITHDLDALADAWAWTPDDVLVHGLPLFHVHGLILGVLGALRTGSRLVHTGRPVPTRYAAAGGTLYFGVPTVWSRVCADPSVARALRPARLLVSGSAPLPPAVFDALGRLAGHRPVERYGMTETLITVSTRAGGPRAAGTVGIPLAGMRTRLSDLDTGEPLPAGAEAVGELQVRTPTLFLGYLGDARATVRSYTVDGWFRTGDAAGIRNDGSHVILGRAGTDMIKTGGFRVGTGEIEDVLLAHPAVREAAVIGAPNADLGQEIVAYVVADSVAPAALTDFVAARLSRHKRPRRVHVVESLPRNALGKVQKNLLR